MYTGILDEIFEMCLESVNNYGHLEKDFGDNLPKNMLLLWKVSEKELCKECAEKVVYITEPRCKKCGKPVRYEEQEYCYDCQKKCTYI